MFNAGHSFRPYQAFRRCDVEVDRTAKQMYLTWVRSKFIPHPLLPSGITVTSIENCLPDMWKVSSVYEVCIYLCHVFVIVSTLFWLCCSLGCGMYNLLRAL